MCALDILIEDGPVLAVNKPAGLPTQGVPQGIPSLESQVRDYIKTQYNKPGNVYLGIPHRLDRPVSGVVLFTKNSKAAARMAEQFRERQVRKIYWAVVEQPLAEPTGTLVDWLLKIPDQARVEVVPPGTDGARECVLSYRVLQQDVRGPGQGGVLVEIELGTGRMHQIRVQFASRGWPIVGDRQYGARTRLLAALPIDPLIEPIALHARSLTFLHPVRYDSVTVTAPVPDTWGRFEFTTTHDRHSS